MKDDIEKAVLKVNFVVKGGFIMDNKNTTSKLFGLKLVLLRKKNNLTQLQLSK